MASPLSTAKPTVSLSASGPPGSRIRRDPVPVQPELEIIDPQGRDARMVLIGVITFALAIVVASLGLMAATGWSPRDYIMNV